MTISELICKLQSIKCEKGDLPVDCLDTAWQEVDELKMHFLEEKAGYLQLVFYTDSPKPAPNRAAGAQESQIVNRKS